MSQDLTPSNLPAKPITPVLSPELKRLLDGEQSDEDTAEAFAGSVALRDEAKAMLPVLKAAATQKAGDAGVRDVIGRRFALYPQPQRSDGEWAAWWADYYDTLSDVPWQALEAAMAIWVADPKSEFLPKPGKLREMAMTTPFRAAKYYGRARKAVDGGAGGPLANSTRAPSPQQAEAVRRMAREAAERMAASGMRARGGLKVTPPNTAGKPDETGLTPAMKAVIERQRAQA